MALFDFFKKRAVSKQETTPIPTPVADNIPSKPVVEELESPQATPPIKISVSITTRVVEDDTIQRTKGMMKLADVEGYSSPSGGFVNYARFCITGKHSETGRKKKKRYEAQSNEEAIALAICDGLAEPFDVEIERMPEPTERQIEYARDLNAVIPDAACQYDVSAIISRITDDDELPPDAGLSRYAHACGVKFSRFVGRNAMLGYMVSQLKGEKLATLYAYAVYLHEKGGSFSDPRVLSNYETLKACGNYVAQDVGLMKSLDGRGLSDFQKPNKGTKVYKAVSEYLELKL